MHKPESIKENDGHYIIRDFVIKTDSLTSARKPDLMLINKKENEFAPTRILRFQPTSVKIKEIENFNEYFNLAWELKKLWYIRVMIVLILVGTLDTVALNLERRLGELEISGITKTILITTLLRWSKILN